MQVPVTMDQVLLEWEGGSPVLLARVRDAEECWLCLREVYSKLCSSVNIQTWYTRIERGEFVSCRNLLNDFSAISDASLFMLSCSWVQLGMAAGRPPPGRWTSLWLLALTRDTQGEGHLSLWTWQSEPVTKQGGLSLCWQPWHA